MATKAAHLCSRLTYTRTKFLCSVSNVLFQSGFFHHHSPALAQQTGGLNGVFTAACHLMFKGSCEPCLSHKLSYCSIRYYASKRKKCRKQKKVELDSDDEDDEDEFDPEEVPVPLDAPGNFRIVRNRINSVRVDAILAQGLGMTRGEVDDKLFESKILKNRCHVLKKGSKVNVGDYMDLIVERKDEGTLRVKRVQIISIGQPASAKGGSVPIVLRAWRGGIDIDDPGDLKFDSDEYI